MLSMKNRSAAPLAMRLAGFSGAVLGAFAAFILVALAGAVSASEGVPQRTSTLQTAVFAGGCFWGVDGVFKHVKGVTRVVSGYAGGQAPTAHYEVVSTGTTGHAESVEVTYDPSLVSYDDLLKVFFRVAHDPTELNRQGPDEGTQYRSAIFFADAEQRKIADDYIAKLKREKMFSDPIVTGGAAQGFLSGRGLPSELPRAASGQPVHRDQRSAQDRGLAREIPGAFQAVESLAFRCDHGCGFIDCGQS